MGYSLSPGRPDTHRRTPRGGPGPRQSATSAGLCRRFGISAAAPAAEGAFQLRVATEVLTPSPSHSCFFFFFDTAKNCCQMVLEELSKVAPSPRGISW